ncbi:MAG: L-seryl-tRNA(Sec) selenium transferase [Acidimicrobiia bacterium]|jgi:L-seryl-tRNA(Ser) seleniumtransferase
MDRRRLPSVDRLAADLVGSGLPRSLVVEIARASIDEAREVGGDPLTSGRAAAERLARMRPTEVINATGVLLHTNLGRALVHPEAADAAQAAAVAYGSVELDLDTGARGGRGAYLERLLVALTGAEAAIVVNNNAAALLVVLMALAAGRAVPVSRGELIEIGGSYRLPEIMAVSTASMLEVGTTNRTRSDDYRRALEADPALILKVHPSNYRISGFTEDTALPDLAEVAGEAGIPLAFDAGSGLLDEDVPWLPGPPPDWLDGEPGVVQALAAGSDLVMFSGDKLLGGPQAGIVVGRADLVGTIRNHPAARAMRLDGPTLAALTVTLDLYASGRGGEVPFWRMASLPYAELEARARRVLEHSGLTGVVGEGASTPGAGSVPTARIASPVIRIEGPADGAFHRLLAADPPVLARREAGTLIVDLRTVEPDRDELVARSLGAAWRS